MCLYSSFYGNRNNLIKALSNYEKTMLEGNNDTFFSINKMIMDAYGGEI